MFVLAVLAVSLFLALLPPLSLPHPKGGAFSPTSAIAPVANPARFLPATSNAPATLWTLLTPWAMAVDAIALLGLGAVLFVRRPRT
jgi:hypothetical protein